ncbi:Zinc finger and BTB domain-containing protein 11 [Bagarius yarrelli]|uniref:Zinc finger and BTB domain-containing protein 11 n=1 Tax=Bagarius yarrelli TaxID=175774 RepID=A0A556VYA9_BAGYA|nr:Zinc finger and BTB domain-containing protein 11 [Bagarius yarrelli]
MSSEESYLAIQRYLTDSREPYAPGTHGNVKRKIRKAAACYVVRDGVLYYQRRHRGQEGFTELKVVLQAEQRKELINEAHISNGEHFNQHLTWENLSKQYWWRGILKQVKDYIKDCGCQQKSERGKGNAEEGPVPRGPSRKTEDNDEEEEEEADLEELHAAIQLKSKGTSVDKHELVFVDSKGVVKQFLPKHGQTMLEKLNQQRLNNQFCDITLLIESEEYRAHKAVLASCSAYFYELFVEKGAVASHEAVVDLAGFSKASFLPLLDFAYTSELTFNFCVMAEVAMLARHLHMPEVLQICESVHKKVEEQKLMVFQQGDVHTVIAKETLPAQPMVSSDSGAFVVAMETDGQGVVASSGQSEAEHSITVITGEDGTAESLALLAGATVDGETMTVVTHSGQAGLPESLSIVAHNGQPETGETMTVVTHSGQAGSSESLAVVQACWTVDEPQVVDTPVTESTEPRAYIISVEPDKMAPTEKVQLAATSPTFQEDPLVKALESLSQPVLPVQQLPAPVPQKRRPGRPPKVKQPPPEQEPVVPEVAESVGVEEEKKEEEESLDPNKRFLRKRSIREGGYIRLHMGIETEEEEANAVKTPQKLAKRGRLSQSLKRPSADSAEPEPQPASDETKTPPEGAEADGPPEGAEADEPEVTSAEALAAPEKSEAAVDGEHMCSECGVVFQRRYTLIMHMLKHEKSRSFKCTLCTKEFQYAVSLRAHLARHKHQKTQRASLAQGASDEVSDESEGQSKSRTKREFVCDICGKKLPKLYSLRIHMLNHTGVRPHSCRVCGKSFATKHNLKMHRAQHDSAKRFYCTMCEKSFVTQRSLSEHISVHTGKQTHILKVD